MVTCSVRDCDVTRRNNPNGYTFHRLPSNPALREKWMRTINRPTWTPSKNSTICSKHFDGKCFIQRIHRRVLMKDSVPTLFVPKMADKKKLYKCDKCIRTYTNSNALENHKRLMHGLINSSSSLKSRANKTKATLEKFERYQCPVCKATFPSKFVAAKHIEVYHKKHVKAGSIQSIKLQDSPNACKQKNNNISLHSSTSDKQKNKIAVGYNITHGEQTKTKNVNYFCYLCSKMFNNAKKFTVHVETQHNKNVETMFFPNMTQFIYWKEHLEKLANIQYRLSSEEINGRQYYHCIITKVTDMFTERCPSIIVVQSYSKGILARLFKNHARHKVSEYTLGKDFRKYCITDFLPSSDSTNGYDPYLDLKMLLENILEAAAKIKMSSLKELIEKALEMTVILNTYHDDNDDPLKVKPNQSKALNDAQIREVLQLEETVTIKRENSDLDMAEPLNKKAHMVDVAPKIVNTYSLADNPLHQRSDTDSCDENDIDNKILISNYVGKYRKPHDTKKDLLNALKDKEFSSFNDTYRDFVRKNLCLSTPMVTRSRVSQGTINKKNNKRAKSTSVPAAITPKGIIYDNLSKTSDKLSTNSKETVISSDNIDNCNVNSTNKSADCPVKTTNISTTDTTVHSGLTPVVITPTPTHLMNNNMVFVAVPYAPMNTLDPTATINPFFNVVGVSMPQHINVTQQTLSTDFVTSIKTEAVPIKQECGQDYETSKTDDEDTNTEVERTDTENEKSDAENKKRYTETSDSDGYEGKSEQKPKVKLENVCKYIRTPKKIDFEYEVIEQESDCNILVLKL